MHAKKYKKNPLYIQIDELHTNDLHFHFILLTASEVFVTEPEDVYVPEGSPAAVTFSCKVDSSNPVYTWMKDKKTIDLSANCKRLAL